MRSVHALAAAVLSLLAISEIAHAGEKQGGIFRIYHRDSPGSASIHEEATYSTNVPFMTVGELGHLLALAPDGCGIVPLVGQTAEPLAAIYPAEAADDFQAALGGADFSLQSVVRTLNARERMKLVPISNESAPLYRSVNSPGDFKEGRFPNRPPNSIGPATAG